MNIVPKKTSAIIVGIENYNAGQSWDLNGPAHDACQFATWLCNKQVPSENITLFISPLDENRQLALPNGLSFQAATEQNVTNCIENTLAQSIYDLLYFYWGGHGVITTVGERRLFYADATVANKKNLDLNLLLVFLRTDYFQASALSRQIVIVDACANYATDMKATKELPQRIFPNGEPLENREQYVLMAAKPGESAKNLGAEKTGLFTKELMAQLANQPENEWPPNMDTVQVQVHQRFIALHEAGQSEQTPTYFYYKDWYSNQGIDEMLDQNHVQTPIPEEQVLELLERLSITQFKKVLLLYKIPKSEIPPAGTRGEQNLALFEYAYQKEGEQLTNLVNLIYKIAPHLQRGDV